MRTARILPFSIVKKPSLHPTHPLYTKFARLTAQEEKRGLLDDPSTIGTRTAWLARLQAHSLTLRGHRLVKVRLTSDANFSACKHSF